MRDVPRIREWSVAIERIADAGPRRDVAARMVFVTIRDDLGTLGTRVYHRDDRGDGEGALYST